MGWALGGGLVLVAAPMVLWLLRPGATRRPAVASSAAAVAVAEPPDQHGARERDAGAKGALLSLGPVWVDRCERPGPGRTPRDRCDRQPFFEQALVQAILDNESCARGLRQGATVSIALKVDYWRKTMRVFAGKSGSEGPLAASRLISCVHGALPAPDWGSLGHEHTKYVIAVVATVGDEPDAS